MMKLRDSNVLSAKDTRPKPNFFSITNKTLKYGDEIYQIKNLTRVGKYKVVETKMPLRYVIIIMIVGFILLYTPVVLLGFILLGIGVFGILGWIKAEKYAFGIETNAGNSVFMYTENKQFIDKVVQIVTEIMENEDIRANYTINFQDRSVHHIETVGGSIQTGNSTTIESKD